MIGIKNDPLYSLADKFMIKGHSDLAHDLTHAKNNYMNKLKHTNSSVSAIDYHLILEFLSLLFLFVLATHPLLRYARSLVSAIRFTIETTLRTKTAAFGRKTAYYRRLGRSFTRRTDGGGALAILE